MRKYRLLLISSAVLFLLIGSFNYWEGKVGFWLMPLSIMMFLTFIVLSICYCYQVYMLIKQRFKDKPRLYAAGSILLLLLLVAFVVPKKWIEGDDMEGEDLVTAYRKGVAGCGTVLKLKKDHRFYLRQSCFGVEKFNGRYLIDNDTIRFQSDQTSPERQYQYALVKPETILGGSVGKSILLFRSKRDTVPLTLTVRKDELTMGLGY